MTRILIACDHRGIETMDRIVYWCKENGHDPVNMGPSTSESVDYPDFAFPCAEKVVESNGESVGILICGWGNGMAIAANKVKGARAALCTSPIQAAYARWHNNANILVISAEATGWGMMTEIINVFLKEGFDGGRHERRINKISDYERG
ncbi:MAG: RpiB/LacA/LacB family sugar-phosphate isomerase [bacterium]|nr:RpiB/LacA/LacB family sugar-phosphate isomerase [bacterium]